jgi:hypothetical protein
LLEAGVQTNVTVSDRAQIMMPYHGKLDALEKNAWARRDLVQPNRASPRFIRKITSISASGL